MRPRNGPSAGGEHEPGDLVGTVAGPQALVQRTVLGVHGDDLGSGGLLGTGHHRRPGDQGFLVGEGQAVPGSERGQRDGQSGETRPRR